MQTALLRIRFFLVLLTLLKKLNQVINYHFQNLVLLQPLAALKAATDAEYSIAASKQSKLFLFVFAQLSEKLSLVITRGARDLKLNLFLNTMRIVLVFLSYDSKRGVQVSIRGKPWTCHLAIISYSRDTPEGRNMSDAKLRSALYLL